MEVCFFEHVNGLAIAGNLARRIDHGQGHQSLRILLLGVDHHLRAEATKDVNNDLGSGVEKRVDAMMSAEEAEEDDRTEL